MSRIYDNWERLVAAVLKREEIWQICHAHSRNSSIGSTSSDSNPNSSSQFDENFKPAKSEVQESASQIEDAWIEQYEPGVYITLAALSDGTREVKRMQFSRKKFKAQEAETWWRENQKKVHEKYIAQGGLVQVIQLSISNQAASGQKELFLKESKENNISNKPNELLVALSETTSGQNLNSANSEVQGTAREIKHDWTEQYEPGVYITVGASRDGSTEVKRVRFRYMSLKLTWMPLNLLVNSKRKFKEKGAETWWIDNREKVYQKYNDLIGLARLGQSSISGQADSASKVPFLDRSEESKSSKDPDELNSLGRNEHPLLETTFDKNMKSTNSEVQATVSQIVVEWVERYERGVHVTLGAFRDETRDVLRVRFSRRRFTVQRAEAWWLKNRQKIYEKYNSQAGLARIRQSSGQAPRWSEGAVTQGKERK